MKLPIVLERPELLPVRATPGSAGLDLRAAGSVTIAPGTAQLVSTGVKMNIPEGNVGLLFGRSSLGLRRGLRLANSVGVIDSDFPDTVQVVLFNDSSMEQSVGRGERVAQIVVMPVTLLEPEVVDELGLVGERTGGFGSTGTH